MKFYKSRRSAKSRDSPGPKHAAAKVENSEYILLLRPYLILLGISQVPTYLASYQGSPARYLLPTM